MTAQPRGYEGAVTEMARNIRRAPPQSRWVHRRSGHFYTVACHALIEAHLTPAVVYFGSQLGATWVRPAFEFFDRFEPFPNT